MIFLIWLTVLVSSFALYLHKVYSKYSKYGIRQLKPVPVLGNSTELLIRKIHLVDNFNKLYRAFPEDRFMVIYNFMQPSIVIKDLELIKNIAIKDFEHFLDHSVVFDDGGDPVLQRNLLALKGQEWKEMRSSLSPAFTSSKMRFMVPFMDEVSNQMIKSLKNRLENSKDKFIDEDCRDLSARFANDVIATCAFGLKVDSHNEKDNEFYKKGKSITNITFFKFILLTALNSIPKFMKIFKVPLFEPATVNFFHKLVMNTVNEREVKNIYRPDMIHLLMEAKRGKLTHDNNNSKEDDAGFATVEEISTEKKNVNKVWADIDLVAQAVLFFFAGFDTVSTTTSFILYELAIAPKIQERLVQEIKENNIKTGGKFDYKSVQNMTYMDMVVSEGLRKWPGVPILDRLCTKDYNLGKPNDKATQDYIIRKGEKINISAWSVHYNPEYYPDPEKFDPERFSEGNKHLIKPFTYMPFGLGPRNCIGSRFALSELKVMLYHILSHFELSPCEKTCIPAQLDTTAVALRMKGGNWIRFRMRSQ